MINSADTPDGSGDIWLESVSCSDTSTRILDDCSNAGVGVHSCAHQNDIGVKCTGKYVCEFPPDVCIEYTNLFLV